MLHDFLEKNRAILVDRCRSMAASRSDPDSDDDESTHGIPIFLDQVIKTLAVQETPQHMQGRLVPDKKAAGADIGKMATVHGRDLLAQGFTLEHVVRDYGDFCQAVMNLAYETGSAIHVDEFRTFNHCLDEAIAGAVTEYARRQTSSAIEETAQAVESRLQPLACELRNHLDAATLALQAIKLGKVGISGATGAVLESSLVGIRNLLDRSFSGLSAVNGNATASFI
jgi:hypothetical protein